jgi:sugar/nucleoside kinase (ribokinase family)
VSSAALFAGLATLDVVSRVETLPHPNQKVSALRQDLAAGGPAANAAVAFAALGGEAVLLTALGRHPIAAIIRDELGSRQVRVIDAAPQRESPPTVSAVTVLDATGDRSVVSPRGAGVQIEGVPPLPPIACALIDGHYPELARAAVKHARRLGAKVVLDSGSWKPVLEELLDDVDIAACSADFRAPGTADWAESADHLRRRVGSVLVTRGRHPVAWWSGDQSGEEPTVETAVVDTLGAGDAFHGALVYALIRWPHRRLAAAIGFANAVAAVRCSVIGPRQWLSSPRLAELRHAAER